MKHKICVLAGDSSGDIYASDLLEKLKSKYPDIEAEGIAGDLAKASGMKLWLHSRDLNFMGFYEVLCEWRKINTTWKTVINNLENSRPDLLILIDYPGFNMRIAKWAKQRNIKIFYYIPPQVWAWGRKRVKKLKAYTDYVAALYPHESNFFKTRNLQHIITKHPLLDKIATNKLLPTHNESELHILLMPGSRKQEVSKHLHDMLLACSELQIRKNRKIIAHVIKAQTPTELDAICNAWADKLTINVIPHQDKYSIFNKVHAACAVSGTASLEVALASIPLLVVYKSNWINNMIFNWLLRGLIKWISLPNNISQKSVVKELFQKGCDGKNICSSLETLLWDSKVREKSFSDLQGMRKTLDDSSEKTIEDAVYNAIIDNK